MVLISICILSTVFENWVGIAEMLGFDSFRENAFPILGFLHGGPSSRAVFSKGGFWISSGIIIWEL